MSYRLSRVIWIKYSFFYHNSFSETSMIFFLLISVDIKARNEQFYFTLKIAMNHFHVPKDISIRLITTPNFVCTKSYIAELNLIIDLSNAVDTYEMQNESHNQKTLQMCQKNFHCHKDNYNYFWFRNETIFSYSYNKVLILYRLL